MNPLVLIEPECLDAVIASAVEVCPRETNGLLIGKKSPRKVKGRVLRLVSLKTAYPLQTDKRKPSSIEHGNLSALNRLLGTLNVMGKGLIGGYHSHPYPNGHTRLTKADREFIEDELARIGKYERFQGMDRWLELVLSVKKKSYSNFPKTGRYVYNKQGKIRVIVNTEQYTGFDIKIGGYLLKTNGKNNGNGDGSSLEKTRIKLLYPKMRK